MLALIVVAAALLSTPLQAADLPPVVPQSLVAMLPSPPAPPAQPAPHVIVVPDAPKPQTPPTPRKHKAGVYSVNVSPDD